MNARWAIAALALSAFLIGPMRPFPLDDDWAFFLSVRRLVERGVMWIPDVTLPNLVAHTAWGALWAKAWGLDPAVLRVSSLAAAAIALACLGALARERRAVIAAPLTPSFLLLANPLFFVLAFTFMTDVPFLAWFLAALLCYRKAGETDELGWWLAAGLAAAAAALTRQIGVFAPCGALAALLAARRLTFKRAALALALPVLALAAHQWWFVHAHGPTWARTTYFAREIAPALAAPGRLAWNLYYRGAAAFLYMCLFTLPWIAGWTLAEGFKRPRAAHAAVMLTALAPLLLAVNVFPFFAGVIGVSGLGVPTVSGLEHKNSGLLGSPWFAAAITAAALASGLAWLGRGRQLLAALRDRELLWTAPPCLLAFAPALLQQKFFDRYVLILVPFVALWLWRAAAGSLSALRGPRLAAASALSAAFWLWSLLGTWDYLNWNQAKWETGLAAVGPRLKARQILNGYDWAGVLYFEEGIEEAKRATTPEKMGEWDWVGRDFKAAVSFSPVPAPGWAVRAERPYRTPLSRNPGMIYLHERL